MKTFPDDLEFWTSIVIKGEKIPYQVSNNGKIRNSKTRKLLKPVIDKYGYPCVCLFYNKKRHNITVHKLVAMTYVKNPKNKPQVNHIDGIKTHNYRNNLEWVTPRENVVHSYKNGLHDNVAIGERHGNNIYSTEQIKNVCMLLEQNKLTYSQISNQTGVRVSTIHDIVSKKYWTHISKNYHIDRYNVRKRKPVSDDVRQLIIKYAMEGKSVHDIRLLLQWEYTDKGNSVILYYVNKYKNSK